MPRALDMEWAVGAGTFWTYGPALAAVAAAVVYGGREELRRLGGRLTDWRIGARWYLVILLFPLTLSLVEGAITAGLLGDAWTDHLPAVFAEPVASSILVFIVLTLTDGIGEELGWRGFALGNMIKDRNAMVMSFVLGLLWAAWHLPLFWTRGASLEGSEIWIIFARLPAAAVLYTWLYQHTRGSVVAAALFHAALSLFAQPPPAAGEDLTASLVSLGLYWVSAAVLIAAAGASRLDRWPGVAQPSRRAA